MRLRVARKVHRWCNPSLSDMDGGPAFDRDALAERARRYRQSTRVGAARAVAKAKRRTRRVGHWPIADVFQGIFQAADAPADGYITPLYRYWPYIVLKVVEPRPYIYGINP